MRALSFVILVPLLAARSAAEPSLLQDRPKTALVNEIIELRPAAGRHFNPEAPQKCDGDRPLEVLARRVRCQMARAGRIPVLVSVCDDARTFCRQERFDVDVQGLSGAAAESSPMTAVPARLRPAPENFLDNAPDQALAQARKEGKLLLIDFYGIWCPPCNDLEEHSYPTPEFRAASRDFVKVALDADRAASFEWKALFKVGGYPTLIVADDRLREIGRVVGWRSGPALARFLDDARALRGEPMEAAAQLASSSAPGASDSRRVRVARWRADRGEYDQAEALLAGLPSPEARKTLLQTRRDHARAEEDAAAESSSLKELLRQFPDDASFPDWASALAEKDASAAKPLESSLRRSVERWSADPGLGAAGFDPGDLLYDLADFLDAIGSRAAAKAVWSRVADAYAAQAARSPLAMPRAANFSRAEALRKAGRKAEAKALYEALVKAYPEEFTFNYEYAFALAEDGSPEAAYPYALKAVENGYGDNWLRAVRLKAELELRLNRTADAAKTIDEALAQTVAPKSAAVRTNRYISALRTLRGRIDKLRRKMT